MKGAFGNLTDLTLQADADPLFQHLAAGMKTSHLFCRIFSSRFNLRLLRLLLQIHKDLEIQGEVFPKDSQ